MKTLENDENRFLIEALETLPEEGEISEWLVPGILVKGGLNYITAYPGHGKSLVCLELAQACVEGRKFLQVFDVPRMPVLYIDQDSNSKRELNKRVLDFGFNCGDPFLRMNQQGLRLDLREDVLWLRGECKQRGIGLVIFDALVRMHRLNEGSSADMAVIRDHLQLLTSEGITLLIIHHNSRRMTFRGSSEIIAMADAMVNLKKSALGKSFTLEIVKQRTECEADWNRIDIRTSKLNGATVLTGRTYMAADDESTAIEEEIVDFCLDSPRTKSEIRSQVRGDVVKIDATIELLVSRGDLGLEKIGSKKLYRSMETASGTASLDVVD